MVGTEAMDDAIEVLSASLGHQADKATPHPATRGTKGERPGSADPSNARELIGGGHIVVSRASGGVGGDQGEQLLDWRPLPHHHVNVLLERDVQRDAFQVILIESD